METDNKFKYYAFISYKRKDKDEELAKWLQDKLEHYKLPQNLNDITDLPKEIRPIFRDQSDMAGGVLDEEISKALESSKSLIVICSPRAAQSKWVNLEVETFIKLGKTDKIIPFIIDGEAYAKNPEEECFPLAIRNLPKELIGINISDMGRDAAAVKVVAQMFGLKFDELWQRHEREQTKRRNWIIAASITGFLIMAGVAFWMYAQRQETLKANWQMMENQARFVSEKAKALVEEDSYLSRLLLLEVLPEYLHHPKKPFVPEAETALREAYNMNTAILHNGNIYGQFKRVSCAVFSPNGKQIVTASTNQTLKIWDAVSGQCIRTIKGDSPFHSAFFSPDGKQIVSTSGWGMNGDNNVKIWDAVSGQLYRTMKGHKLIVTYAVFSPDGEQIVSTSEDRTLKIWDAESGQLIQTIEGDASFLSASFAPDKKQIVSVYGYPREENTIRIWDAETGQLLQTMNGSPASCFADFSPDGERVVSASKDGSVIVWDASSGQHLQTLTGHTDAVCSATFSPDGKRIVSSSYDNSVRIWDVVSGQEIKVLKGHSHTVAYAAFSPSGEQIVSASWDNTARIWDISPELSHLKFEGHLDMVNDATFSPDGKLIASASNDNTIRVWDAISGQQTMVLDGHTGDVCSAVFSPDGKQIASSSDDGTIRLWDVTSGRQIFILELESNSYPNSVAFNSDGKLIFSAWSDNTIRIWDAVSGIPVLTQENYGFDINCNDHFFTFSPDIKQITSGGWGDIIIWDVLSGQPLQTLKGHTDIVQSVAYSPDGKQIVSASWDNTVRIWNAISGELIQVLNGQTASAITVFTSAAFSPDGKLVVTAVLDDSNSIIIWDVDSGLPIHTFTSHTGTTHDISFSPDGRRIVSASYNGTVHIWPFPTLQDLIDQTHERFKDRPLTDEERRLYYLE